jgi:hypothetical protein
MLNVSHRARVDFKLLVLFQVVLEAGNVGPAADRLPLPLVGGQAWSRAPAPRR